MIYRIRQLWRTLFPHIQPEELAWVRSLLSGPAWLLFQKQSLPEQRHSLDVAQDLTSRADSLDPRQMRTLLTAALLHDCGKSRINIKIKHRVLAVLLSPWSDSLQARFASHSSTTALALSIHKKHACWGSDLAAQAGLDAAIQTLIIEHHSPQEPLGKLLEQADSRH